MEKLTVLFFSRNDIDNAIGLVNDIKDVADEIVLIDQSDKEEKKKLMAFKRRSKLRKFKVYDCIALGYPEPLQAYAFTKCTNEWVLRLDTDERIPEAFKRDIKRIVTETKSDSFAIKRYEFSGTDGKSNSTTWQTRLFKRSKTKYTGILDEQPSTDGRLEKLDAVDYYISHSEGLMNHEVRKRPFARYQEISRIDQRLSYELYNMKIIDYLSKFLAIKPETVKNTIAGKVVINWMKFYEWIFFKKMDQEVGDFDYFIYYSLINLAFVIQRKKPSDVFKIPAIAYRRLKNLNELKALPDGRIYFEISKIINKIGIIRFLELDNPDVMDGLTKKYKNKRQGVALLIELLKEKYLEIAKPQGNSGNQILFQQ